MAKLTKPELLKRMQPQVAKTSIPADVAKARTTELATLTPLESSVTQLQKQDATKLDRTTYQGADQLLGEIQKSRRGWGAIWGHIHERSVKPMLVALEGLYEVNRDIDRPLERMEKAVKAWMKDWKIEETRQLYAASQEEQRLQRESERIQQQLDNARTAKQREKLAAQKEMVEEQVEKVSALTVPTQGVASSTRFKKVWGLLPGGLIAVIDAVQSGELPPDVLTINTVFVDGVFKESPETVEGWPGFAIGEDVTIVGRG